MRAVRRPPLLLLLLAAVTARADDRGAPPPVGPQAPPDFYAATARDARVVRVVPLAAGRRPDLEAGVEVRLGWGGGVDLDRSPGLLLLPDGDLLVIAAPEWVRLTRVAGAWRERVRGAWPAGWGVVGAADLDRDGCVDLAVLPPRAQGARWEVAVARGDPAGGFDVDAPRQVVAPGTHAGFFALGDVDEDGTADLLFHLQEHGADVPVSVQLAAGRRDGSGFEPARTLARGVRGASSMALARLGRDARRSIVLGCDDDLDDAGQAQELVQGPDGAWTSRDGVDLEPGRESWTSDEGYWILTPTDVDLDGFTDLVARLDAWATKDGKRMVIVHLLRGDERGFGPAEPLIVGQFPVDATPSLAFPPAP